MSIMAFVPGVGPPNVLAARVSSLCGKPHIARCVPCKRRLIVNGSPRMGAADQGSSLQSLTFPVPSRVVAKTSDGTDLETACALIYKQVFGNAYVMESERAALYPAESMFRGGRISVKEFVRRIALSSTYRRRFFECCAPYRAVELNLKHLLGRGPQSKEEVAEHVQRTCERGYHSEINFIIDSPEYDAAFGDSGIPRMLFKGTYPTLSEFTQMCSLYSAPGTSDKSTTRRAKSLGTVNPNHVLSLDGAGVPSKTVAIASATRYPTPYTRIKKAVPSRADTDFTSSRNPATSSHGMPVVSENATQRSRVKITEGNYLNLTPSEAAEYAKSSFTDSQTDALIKAELRAAEAEILRLQARIKSLST